MNQKKRIIRDFNWEKYGRTAFAAVQMTADTLTLAGLSAAAIAYEATFRASDPGHIDWRLYVLATSVATIAVIANFARASSTIRCEWPHRLRCWQPRPDGSSR